MADVIKAMAAGLQSLGDTGPSANAKPAFEGVVTARKSLASPDHIISMIDGKPYSSLKRHLAKPGLTQMNKLSRTVARCHVPFVKHERTADKADAREAEWIRANWLALWLSCETS